MSKPTWWDTFGYSITSAFFVLTAFDGHLSQEGPALLTTRISCDGKKAGPESAVEQRTNRPDCIAGDRRP